MCRTSPRPSRGPHAKQFACFPPLDPAGPTARSLDRNGAICYLFAFEGFFGQASRTSGASRGGNVVLAEQQGLEVRETGSARGKSLFATRVFAAGDIIWELQGKMWDWDDVSLENVNCIQIGPRTYLMDGSGLQDFLNHSCDPSAGIRITGTEVTLVAIRDIRAGEEVTFDYSTTVDEDFYTLKNCRCGSPTCRGTIRDFKHLPRDLQEKYIALRIVPDYCIEAARTMRPARS